MTPRIRHGNRENDMEIEDYSAETLGYLPLFTLMLTASLRQQELPAPRME